jgi:hypothetical protein
MPARMTFGLRWRARLVAPHRGRQWRALARAVAAGLGLACSAVAPATPLAASDAAQLGALDCAAVSAGDVREVLSRHPAPRVIALQGSVPIVTMEPFAEFLVAMGYPDERVRDPVDGRRSYSSFVDSRRVVGEVAWHYEQDGVMPILIGHSQGGMIVIKVLHDLAGNGGAAIPVWGPGRPEPEPRTVIVDPRDGAERPVVGLKLDFAAALATGSLPRLLLGQWGILPLLREVPDSVAEFTGFAIPWDPIAGTGPEPSGFRATGSARVRNVVLPGDYSHIGLPAVAHLAAQPETRAWIDVWRPGSAAPMPRGVDVGNLLHAADLWYSLKRHWCLGAKALAGAAGQQASRR